MRDGDIFGLMFDRSKYFDREEFECKCGCGEDRLHPIFLQKLEFARVLYDAPFVVESGCRCDAHNEAVGGSPLSQHRENRAADIQCWGGEARFKMVDAMFKAGMTGIGIAKSYIHCDIGLHRPEVGVYRPVVWTY